MYIAKVYLLQCSSNVAPSSPGLVCTMCVSFSLSLSLSLSLSSCTIHFLCAPLSPSLSLSLHPASSLYSHLPVNSSRANHPLFPLRGPTSENGFPTWPAGIVSQKFCSHAVMQTRAGSRCVQACDTTHTHTHTHTARKRAHITASDRYYDDRYVCTIFLYTLPLPLSLSLSLASLLLAAVDLFRSFCNWLAASQNSCYHEPGH